MKVGKNANLIQNLPLGICMGQGSTIQSYAPQIRFTFFAVGSPLGVFLSLRNVRIGIGRGQDYWQDENIIEEMPCCWQMFNIFHPYDPVAYRLYKQAPSLYPTIEVERGYMWVCRRCCFTFSNHWPSIEVIEEDGESTNEKGRSYGSMMMERLTGSPDGRIDRVLQEKTFQHPYLSALGSHTNYW